MKISVIYVLIFLFTFGFLNAQETDQNKSNQTDKRKNSVYLSLDFLMTFAINYERIFPVGERVSLGLRGGFGNDGGNKSLVAIAEGIFLYGKFKHFLEFGVGYQQPFYYFDEGPDSPLIAFMPGYRYQHPKGFLLKICPGYIIAIAPEEDDWKSFPSFGFALGYSF